MTNSKRSENFVLIFLIIVGVFGLGIGLYSFTIISKTTGNFVQPTNSIHWHAKLTILINKRQIIIPSGLGINVGNNIDNHISGMMMSPIHTHDTTGKLHIESHNPSRKPETLTLGYFINEVWGENFNSKCIFDYCTENGSLKMLVNGKENKEFENYPMKDGDEIIIEFKLDAKE